MTPSNNSNGNDPVYTIEDTNNVKRQVVPVAHTHSQSEVEGLSTALSGKMDNKTIDQTPSNNSDHLISSKGVKDALANIGQPYGTMFILMSDFEAPDYIDIANLISTGDNQVVGDILIEIDEYAGYTIDEVITTSQGYVRWDDTNSTALVEDGWILLHYLVDANLNFFLSARRYVPTN